MEAGFFWIQKCEIGISFTLTIPTLSVVFDYTHSIY